MFQLDDLRLLFIQNDLKFFTYAADFRQTFLQI